MLGEAIAALEIGDHGRALAVLREAEELIDAGALQAEPVEKSRKAQTVDAGGPSSSELRR